MIPKIHDKENNPIGELFECFRGIAIEERNGMCEIEIDYHLQSPYADSLIRGNIIVADVNDKLKNQLFRIYKVTKDIEGYFSVYAKHISYDLARDYIDTIIIDNQTCEYCLNQIFRNSQFSQLFTGHSDIINAQNYSIGNANLLECIAGKQGSIIDTFGTGAEILRDNYDFYVFNHRGLDNGVVIEYANNLTGLNYEEKEEGLITRIRAYASRGSEETKVEVFTYVDSPNIGNYETPFIAQIDFSSNFAQDEEITTAKLTTLAEEYFRNN